MTKDFDKLLILFVKQFRGWCDRKLNEYEGDYDRLAESICQLMHDDFYTKHENLTEFISNLTPEKIEKVLKDNSGAGDYCIGSHEIDYETFRITCWTLTKNGETRNLHVDQMKDGYLIVSDLSVFHQQEIYSLDALESSIRNWAQDPCKRHF